ncbi:MAG: hypothetical protein Q7W55_07170 [Pseudohongiella sp.]|nr:hypothetical protein [Pseudohongiella sp.]MDP2126738.1 hypothetical protein [Pseudohongiella sp.]
MRELSESEIGMVDGAGVLTFLRNTIIGGAIYDGAKAAASWVGDTFFAKDGSSGSRYPVDQS